MTIQQFFLGRQPIVGRRRELAAYELLFRNGIEDNAAVESDVAASAAVIQHTFADLGMQAAIGDKPGFINISEDLLMSEAIELLPAEHVVLEILETVPMTAAVVERCGALRHEGYAIALDDVVTLRPEHEPLLPSLSHVKIDIREMPAAAVAPVLRQLRPYRCLLVAEKIETLEEFEQCRALGFDLFQGRFLAKPAILSGRSVQAPALALLKLSALIAADAEVAALEAALKQVPDVTVRLLKLVNSAAFQPGRKVASVRDAIRLAGRVQLNRVVQILLFAQQGGQAAGEDPLLQNAATRGRLMEGLARAFGRPQLADAAFMTGMLSLIDVLLGQRMEDILPVLNLDPQLTAALLRGEGELGCLLRLIEASERGDGSAAAAAARNLPSLDLAQFNRLQVEAMGWARSL